MVVLFGLDFYEMITDEAVKAYPRNWVVMIHPLPLWKVDIVAVANITGLDFVKPPAK